MEGPHAENDARLVDILAAAGDADAKEEQRRRAVTFPTFAAYLASLAPRRSLTAGLNRYAPHQGAKQRAKYAGRRR